MPALVANGVILLKDGSLMAGWYFAGPDSESATDAERNEVSRQINAVLSRLGSGWMIQVEAVRIRRSTIRRARTIAISPIRHARDR
jgi:type IV secretion system protein VirB4